MKQPNILFIMSDDHAANAIGSYGSQVNRTPHIDRIGNEGIRFDNCFCTNSICEPSRAAILCGTYNHVNRVTTIGAHLDNRLPHVAKEFRSGGYQTAIFGKWHLGEGPAHEPTGFDIWKVLIGQGEYHDPTFVENGQTHRHTGYATDLITDFTLDFIRNRDKNRPFMCLCHHKAPHRCWESDEQHQNLFRETRLPMPENIKDDYSNRSRAAQEAEMRIADHMSYRDLKLVPPPGAAPGDFIPHPDDPTGFTLTPVETGVPVQFKDRDELLEFKYQRYLKDYLRCVASIDDNVGRLLDALAAENILDDTIVIYTSDQGFFLGEHGWYDKRFMYEESLRMPLLMRYGRQIRPGCVNDDIVTNVDFAPTFLEMCGLPVPSYMQGRSFRPLTQGCTPADWPQAMYYRYWMHLAHHYVCAHYGIRTQRYKLIFYYGDALGQPQTIDEKKEPEWELFDLEKDPREMNSVYADPAYAAVVESLKQQLCALQRQVGDQPYRENRSR
jgi:arylsulfatase A-like enzyme